MDLACNWKSAAIIALLFNTTALSVAAFAQDTPSPNRGVEEVVVTGSRVRSLEQFTPTGSRLDLPARETPATLDVIDADTMITRGFLNVEEAANSLPGVTSGGAPGDLENFHIRGFSDTQITVLHNGIYVGPSDMVNRPQNAFNVQSVEILKGPSSVLYGQGAIGGAINVVNKAPSFGKPTLNAYGAIGSFGTTAFGVGGSRAFNDKLAVRLDLSRTSTDGYVHGAYGDSLDGTVTLLWKPNPKLDVQLSVDVMSDHPPAYWGTPLVPASFAMQPLNGVATTVDRQTIDSRMRYVNYNVADFRITGSQYWPQLFTRWRATDDLAVENYVYFFHADRKWVDAESYGFNTATRLIDRDRFFVFHRQNLIGDQASATWSRDLFGLKNKLVVGIDYNHLDFRRARGFPDGDSVDPFNPARGSFGPLVERVAPTHWDDTAAFFEDVLDLTSNLKLVTGARYDYLALDRQNFRVDGSFNAASSFKRVYEPVTYRVGLVWDVNRYVTPYLSFTTGQDPVGDNIFTVNADQNFSLGRSRQVEGGVKASAPENRASMTLAVYDIRRDNVLQAISPDISVPIGSETSRGVETSGDAKVTDQWTVHGNLAWTDAKYDRFAYADGSGVLVNASGHRIPNSPEWLANVWTSVTKVGGLPLELGGGVRYVGRRSGNNAGSLTLADYATVNLYATWTVSPQMDLSVRVDNLTDKAFAQSADIFYPTQVMLGRPRYVQFDVAVHF